MVRHRKYKQVKKQECNYHSCIRQDMDMLSKCKYCGELFCKEHLRATPPGPPRFVGTSTEDRMFMGEWRKEGGHPCPPYLRYWEEENKRRDKEYDKALDKIQVVSPKISEPEVSKDFSTFIKPKISGRNEKSMNFSIIKNSKNLSFIGVFRSLRGALVQCLWLFLGVLFLSNIISPYLLVKNYPHMKFDFGNPKPVYFYDIDSTCNDRNNIISALYSLSNQTGVKFIQLPSPLAIIIGGTSYSCSKYIGGTNTIITTTTEQQTITTTEYTAGESESNIGFGMAGFIPIIFNWNKITLVNTDEETILHETLHTMSFDHRPLSIMSAGQIKGFDKVDSDIIELIKTKYVDNLLAYLNIIPLNLLYSMGVILYLLTYPKQ